MKAREKITKSDISSAQIRAARGLLGWSQEDLAVASGIVRRTVNLIEAESASPRLSTMNAIKLALDNAGVEFIETNTKGPGVRLKKPQNEPL